MTRRVVRPPVQSLPNMTGQAMWNKFVNTSESKSSPADKPHSKEVKASQASQLEDRLDTLNVDFAEVSADMDTKQVSYHIRLNVSAGKYNY